MEISSSEKEEVDDNAKMHAKPTDLLITALENYLKQETSKMQRFVRHLRIIPIHRDNLFSLILDFQPSHT